MPLLSLCAELAALRSEGERLEAEIAAHEAEAARLAECQSSAVQANKAAVAGWTRANRCRLGMRMHVLDVKFPQPLPPPM